MSHLQKNIVTMPRGRRCSQVSAGKSAPLSGWSAEAQHLWTTIFRCEPHSRYMRGFGDYSVSTVFTNLFTHTHTHVSLPNSDLQSHCWPTFPKSRIPLGRDLTARLSFMTNQKKTHKTINDCFLKFYCDNCARKCAVCPWTRTANKKMCEIYMYFKKKHTSNHFWHKNASTWGNICTH